MDPEKKQLYGLMTVVEDSQEELQKALAALEQQRAALAQEQIALAQATALLRGVADDVRRAGIHAVSHVVNQATEGAAERAAEALTQATDPVVQRLSGVVQAASAVEASMRRASAWFAWKWVAVSLAGMAGACAVGLAAMWALQHNVQDLRAERAGLQDNIASLERKGARWAIRECGKELCVEVGGKKGGEWKDATTGARLVIPKAY